MREAEEQMISLLRVINRHLDHIARALEAIDDRMADLAAALKDPADDDAAD